MATQRLTERFALKTSGKVRREAGKWPVVEAVLLCGAKSKNGNDYLPSSFRAGAYNGRPCFLNHRRGQERDVQDKIGVFENERRNESGYPVADLAINPEHPMAASVLSAAEHRPDFYGMSHVADCELNRTRGGRYTVEAVQAVISVDLVTDPATTKGFFESTNRGGTVTTIKQLLEKIAAKSSVDQILKLRRLSEMDGMGDLPVDAPAEDAGADDQISAAFKSAIMAVVDDAMSGDSDPKEALGKIKKLLNAHGDVNGDGKVDAEDAADAGTDGAAVESAKARSHGKAILEAVELCERHGFAPKSADLKILTAVEACDREAVVKRLKGTVAEATGPRSTARGASTRTTESTQTAPAAERNGLI